ncbi:protein kilB [Streptomyces sp. NPDC004728]|uniref:protein kilB n=1 Tax=Streptomyces sp. NPDC004728 TaxID=3154289 RepID=UPI0033AB3AB4
MITAIVAVLGTLAGSAIAHLSQRSHRKADDARARRTEALTAVAELATALANHRRAMWVREDLRLRGEDWADARAESHTTRSAITAPLLRVQVLLPSIADAAQTAARAAYSLRASESESGLRARREHAITTTDSLVNAAAAAIAT